MWFNQVQLTNSQTTTKWSNVLSLDHLEQPRAVIEQSDRFHKRLSFFWGTRGQRNRRRSGVTTSWRCKLTMRRRMLLFNQKHKNTKTAVNTSSLFTFSQGRLLFSTVQLRDEFLQTTFACPFQQFFFVGCLPHSEAGWIGESCDNQAKQQEHYADALRNRTNAYKLYIQLI